MPERPSIRGAIVMAVGRVAGPYIRPESGLFTEALAGVKQAISAQPARVAD